MKHKYLIIFIVYSTLCIIPLIRGTIRYYIPSDSEMCEYNRVLIAHAKAVWQMTHTNSRYKKEFKHEINYHIEGGAPKCPSGGKYKYHLMTIERNSEGTCSIHSTVAEKRRANRRDKEITDAPACIKTLRMISTAKKKWAVDYPAPALLKGRENEIKKYVQNNAGSSDPQCPSGGIYSYNEPTVVPTCSIHTLERWKIEAKRRNKEIRAEALQKQNTKNIVETKTDKP